MRAKAQQKTRLASPHDKSRRQRKSGGAHGPFSDLFYVAASRPAK
jgi:hypothetical protein